MVNVSVIIPTYNREKIVVSTIDSVLMQTYRDFEVIVVDDGSTDNTPRVLQTYGDRIIVIRQENTGVSGAINTGIRTASGKWNAILGSDDEWLPEYLAWQISRINSYPEIAAHITNAVTIQAGRENQNHFAGTGFLSLFKDSDCLILQRPFARIIKYSPWFTQTSIIRRDVLLDAGLFDTRLPIGEDLDVIARVALKGSISFCNKILVHIHRREEALKNLSSINVREGVYARELWERVFIQLKNIDNLKTEEIRILNRSLSENRRALANIFLRNNRKKEARFNYLKALLIQPSIKALIKYLISFLPVSLAVKTIRKGKDIKPGEKVSFDQEYLNGISVIIPTYNRARFVNLAIDSVLNQSFQDFEIIIIDDGSTDNTKNVLSAYGNKIRYIYQDNAGVSAARNVGIKNAKKKWIAFLDSDDEWLPDYLSSQMQSIHKFPDASCHIVNSVTIFSNGATEDHFEGTGLVHKLPVYEIILFRRPLSMIIKHSPWFLQAAVIRRDMILKIGLFDQNLKIAEDLDLLSRLAMSGAVSICRKTLVHIHRREEDTENLSQIIIKKGIYACESWSRVFARLRSAGNLNAEEKKTLDSLLSANRRALANIYLMNGMVTEARRYYKDSLLINRSTKSILKYIISFLPSSIAVRAIRKRRNVQPGM